MKYFLTNILPAFVGGILGAVIVGGIKMLRVYLKDNYHR